MCIQNKRFVPVESVRAYKVVGVNKHGVLLPVFAWVVQNILHSTQTPNYDAIQKSPFEDDNCMLYSVEAFKHAGDAHLLFKEIQNRCNSSFSFHPDVRRAELWSCTLHDFIFVGVWSEHFKRYGFFTKEKNPVALYSASRITFDKLLDATKVSPLFEPRFPHLPPHRLPPLPFSFEEEYRINRCSYFLPNKVVQMRQREK